VNNNLYRHNEQYNSIFFHQSSYIWEQSTSNGRETINDQFLFWFSPLSISKLNKSMHGWRHIHKQCFSSKEKKMIILKMIESSRPKRREKWNAKIKREEIYTNLSRLPKLLPSISSSCILALSSVLSASEEFGELVVEGAAISPFYI
jgi:hypothetical protein